MRSAARTRDEWIRLAREAERLGYHSLWTNEHIAIPGQIRSRYPYTPDGVPSFKIDTAWHESMVALAFLAGVTERIRLGTAVIPLFDRDPLSLAKQAASVDDLSGGRLELGLGAGWLAEEAQLLGHPHDHRGARLDECIEILRKAWTQRTFEHHGRFWDYPWEVGVHPQPPQGAGLPIWIGGESERALRTTAQASLILRRAIWASSALRRRTRSRRKALRLEAYGTCDAAQMKTCFLNILTNAVQAMPEGGRIRITAERVRKPDDHESLEVRFADTGPGIPAEEREKVFAPYFSTKTTGFGLGLAITRKIVEDHDGRIYVSGGAAPGAEMVVELPIPSPVARPAMELSH